MVRSELVNLLSERQPSLQRRDVELAVNCILEQMVQTLEAGERIEIRDFGSFEVRRRAPRKARNPKTGEVLIAPAKSAVHFKPGKGMKDRINAGRGHYKIKD